jgi:serine/threonine-protein kinase
LEGIHARRVVHREIRPSTILIGPGNRIQLLDSGVSKVRVHAGSAKTGRLPAFDAKLEGFAYMAPEQVRGSKAIDGRSDLYGVGAVAFHALTGRPPFEGSNALTLITLKLDRDAPRLGDAAKRTWPTAVESFVARSLARDPDRRFATASEAIGAWRRLFD